MTILVTGAAGFIGSNFIINWINNFEENIIALDKLTYAGNLENHKTINANSKYDFVKGDIGDSDFICNLLKKKQPRAIVNFAAESHVDRSIHGPADFIQTNIIGTFRLLEEVRYFINEMNELDREKFRFLHVSTDEVYGSLENSESPFKETNQYAPNSPYSASKASSDHLVRAWYHTYGLPVLTTNCSNNYGPYHFPEKLIPLCISNALKGKDLPIYGDGKNIRDWLYVDDHCNGIISVLNRGIIGETYNIGGNIERTNLEVVQTICDILDKLKPRMDRKSYREQITFIKDRPGHDRRYAIDSTKISSELGWSPKESFESGILKTVKWFINNQEWVENIQSGEYRKWIAKNYS